jgi:hypothetical protein
MGGAGLELDSLGAWVAAPEKRQNVRILPKSDLPWPLDRSAGDERASGAALRAQPRECTSENDGIADARASRADSALERGRGLVEPSPPPSPPR